MWKKWLILLLALMMLPLSALAEGASSTDPASASANAELDQKLAALFKRYKTVGGTVVVARRGEVVYHFDYGYADKKEKVPVTGQTYFKTASVTKMITGMHAMQLVEQGLLDLDAPIGTYLGYEVRHPRHQTDVTLRMLMSHTSALSDQVPTGKELPALVKRSASWEKWAPGSKYRYSNFAGALGSLIECVTGKDMNTSIQEGLFAPLGVDGAYRVPLLAHPEHASLRYNGKGTLARKRDFYPNEPWNGLCDPDHHYDVGIGDLWIRADDLCRLGMLMCGSGSLDGVALLKESTVAEMCGSQQGKGGITADSPYGLCVHRIDSLLEDRMVYGHQGRSEGVLCNLYWEQESGFVFVLITNGCNIRLKDYIATLSRSAFAEAWAVYGE